MKNTLIKPIKRSEIVSEKAKVIPDFVIQSFNEMIAKKWDGQKSIVKVKEVIELILSKSSNEDNNRLRCEIHNNHWLDIEDIYRKEGWKVKVDSPDYTESFDSYYIFS